jgi:hypothetical protein
LAQHQAWPKHHPPAGWVSTRAKVFLFVLHCSLLVSLSSAKPALSALHALSATPLLKYWRSNTKDACLCSSY